MSFFCDIEIGGERVVGVFNNNFVSYSFQENY